MESEWEPVILDISSYKETGTYIMKTTEETAQMLDDHIVMARAMSFSPYKKPFEARIMTLENKLRTTQVRDRNGVNTTIYLRIVSLVEGSKLYNFCNIKVAA